MEYSDSERDDIILNGYNVVTRERTGTTLPKACETCFKTTAGTAPSIVGAEELRTGLQMEEAASSATRGHLNRYSALIAVSVAFLMTI
ncbi:Lysophospholipase 1 [Aspergillus tanneri]|uniref:Lysophospholipase 1 n=1 Tax=Aspergillus tanneri TaxID=1220188 RepID=A0A5M9M987_9EURO|nr:Lysophospholipase 1 [Aspergillus tanneri]KAA8641483.1 Lysophospholipase 1 [Aspergillus tanneri]